MSEHLDKALAAIEAARELDPNQDIQYIDLLSIARLQAEIAQAAALERIADRLDRGALDDAAEIRGESNPSEANRLLDLGWRLLSASTDTNGFPTIVLVRPADVARDHQELPTW